MKLKVPSYHKSIKKVCIIIFVDKLLCCSAFRTEYQIITCLILNIFIPIPTILYSESRCSADRWKSFQIHFKPFLKIETNIWNHFFYSAFDAYGKCVAMPYWLRQLTERRQQQKSKPKTTDKRHPEKESWPCDDAVQSHQIFHE